MRAREFTREDIPSNNLASQSSIGLGAAKGLSAMSSSSSVSKNNTIGSQPKPLTLTATPDNTQQSNIQKNKPMGVNSQTTQQQQDATVLANRLGMNPQQSQQFTKKITSVGTIGPTSAQQQISPQNMQQALPKPGSNLNIKGIGSTKVLPTPSDSKGIKLDTTRRLEYPITVDPRDLQQ